MQVEFAFLCDAATESGGKVYALGVGVDRLQVPQVPVRHGRLTLAARLVFDGSEAGSHHFAIRLVDADGRPVLPETSGDMQVVIGPPATQAKTNLLIELVNAEFQSYGPHEVALSINGGDVVALPLEVVPTP